MPEPFELPEVEVRIPWRPDGWQNINYRLARAKRVRRGLKEHSEKFDGNSVQGVQFDDLGYHTLLSKAEIEAEENARRLCPSKS